MPDLLSQGGGPADARCVSCGALAVGPCARCRNPVCGDCCVLTSGGSTTFAICLACERRGGSSLTSGWYVVLGWFLKPMLALVAALVVLYLLFGDSVR
ncbi:MAG TPA: hypothetical protein VFZ53_25380 [Polyangiaceae bacterium]